MRQIIAAGLGAVLTFSAPALAQDFPTKTIEIVVQNAPGGASDIFARTLARSAEEVFGQPVIVVNRAGGGGAAQMAAVKAAAPDGYTIGVNTLSHFTAMLTNLQGVFAPEDFSWIAQVQQDAHVLFVREDSPYQDFGALVEGQADTPLAVGGYGAVGSIANIATRLVTDSAELSVDWVGYDSSTEAITGLLGGHVQMAVANPGPVLDFARAGRVRILGVLSEERSPAFPDVPTFAEQGFESNAEWQQIRGIYGPAGIPDDIRQILADGLIAATQTEEFQRYQDETAIEGLAYGPAEYAERVEAMMDLAREGLASVGIGN
ncbi:Bug family tripartite tricarboxylate transporter substrate binding protein [Paracoccus gahaiensis]|nr:tripartite tricarboxylate transporter substrate binding protein [Paracoccus gahaiensis]